MIGIGLLGGSVGLAARRAWPDVSVVGFARSQETLASALSAGAATEVTDNLQSAVREADLICVGTPVTLIAGQVIEIASLCHDDALITDVGSTKGVIVRTVEQNGFAAGKFIGSHPIAGGEKTGPQFAKADLFDQRLVVVTPTDSTDPLRLANVEAFWKSLGANVVRTRPEQHDDILAATSHLPHLVAAVLASIIPVEAIPFAGPGWRDTTRIAGGCPEMWAAICKENRPAIKEQLSRMINSLDLLRNAVDSGDASTIKNMLVRARENRQQVDHENS